MEIKTMLKDEIGVEIEELSKIQVGTEDYEKAVNGIAKLIDKYNDIDKIKIDTKAKTDEYNLKIAEHDLRQREADLKEKELEADAKNKKIDRVFDIVDKVVKNGITAAGIILPLYVTVWGTYVSFEFEREDTITTTLGRGFLNKLLPKK